MPEEDPSAKPKPESEPLGWAYWLIPAVGIIAFGIVPFVGMTQQNAIRSERNMIRSVFNSPHYIATDNIRQIGFSLREFDTVYGSYPSDTTAAAVSAKFPTHGHNLSGRSSNALFRQFFAAGLTQSEVMFYAKVPGTRKPDGDITPGKLLKKGEVGFAYVAGLSSADNPGRPIIFSPVIPGTKRLDPKPFDGNAIFLHGDNSVSVRKIDNDGHVLWGGIDILSPEHPIWEGKAPDIRYPE